MNIMILNEDIEVANRYREIINSTAYKTSVVCFTDAFEAHEYFIKNLVDIVITDAELNSTGNCKDGLALAQRIKKVSSNTAVILCHSDGAYIREHNIIGVDYYLVTPISDEVLIATINKMCMLISLDVSETLKVQVEIREDTLSIIKGNTVVDFKGKMKMIMEIIINAHGGSVTNQEIFSRVWPGRTYGNQEMKVYHNALSRIRKTLKKCGLADLIISSRYSQTWIGNTSVIDTIDRKSYAD